jgi:superfamily I DNA/RNA helicase
MAGPEQHKQEERRLAHVAVTRAQERLYISSLRTFSTWEGSDELEVSEFGLPAAPVVECKRFNASKAEAAIQARIAAQRARRGEDADEQML